MTKEIDTRIVVVTMVFAILFSLSGTFLIISKITSIDIPQRVLYLHKITGFDAQDRGEIRINITATLGIMVNATNNTILYHRGGGCQ